MKLPKLNKKITDFFIGEEGSISKDKLIKVGIVIGTVAIGSNAVNAWGDCAIPFANSHVNDCGATPASNGYQLCHGNDTTAHANNIVLSKADTIVSGSHCNGVNSHTSHSSHGSHGSHGSSTI